MEFLRMSEEQKEKIVNDCINTQQSYPEIAKKNNITIKTFYQVLQWYCIKNNYKTFRRTRKGVVFEKERETNPNRDNERRKKSLKNAQLIEEWCNDKCRMPRKTIQGVEGVAKEGENETEEQKELRLANALGNIRTNILNEYKGKSLEEIENETEREIVKIIRGLDEKYRKNKGRPIKTKNEKTVGFKEKKKINYVQKFGNEKMKKMILNLVKTKNATEEQIQEIAKFYGVDLEKIENIKE